MIIGIGTDITEVSRIKEAVEKYGERFLKRVFTELEIDYCEAWHDKKYVHYAARFAAKESFSKAIGTGITKGFKFREVGVRNEPGGRPVADLSGDMLEKWGAAKVHVSLSHTDAHAVAHVIIEGE